MKLWLVIVVVGALNFLSRLSFIALFSQRTMPPLLERALRFVPAAMLTALVVPMVVLVELPGVAANPRVPAAIIALVVAILTGSTLKTLATGMVALWAIEWLLRA